MSKQELGNQQTIDQLEWKINLDIKKHPNTLWLNYIIYIYLEYERPKNKQTSLT